MIDKYNIRGELSILIYFWVLRVFSHLFFDKNQFELEHNGIRALELKYNRILTKAHIMNIISAKNNEYCLVTKET